jgi:hypothetical protein
MVVASTTRNRRPATLGAAPMRSWMTDPTRKPSQSAVPLNRSFSEASLSSATPHPAAQAHVLRSDRPQTDQIIARRSRSPALLTPRARRNALYVRALASRSTMVANQSVTADQRPNT